ncbi:ceramide-1-phosphate transfer protein-like isoform X2 [Rhinatrema bivittatum]|uniref:ceramide-1-phosphate transfer protein-like isoform X2 n=1 Tax=Rhinatrema bivittatum TaxID=194408 RepID=UPI00112A2A86|nr:ceramide-1-phosphate transfer protein-like isoform X2 [Rhinatrema bivittatum]
MASLELNSLRFYKLFLPLAALLVLIYLTCVRLQVHLSTCVEDGRPCNQMPSKIARDHEENKKKERMTLKAVTLQDEAYTRHCAGKEFQITRVLAAFRSCVSEDGQILLKEYLSGWEELIKFMDSLGMVFGFISQETTTKINIMHEYLGGRSSAKYQTLQSMVKHELHHGLVNFKELPRDQVPSGCRTLLRLHRALKWLELFLYKLSTSTSRDRTGELCAEAYKQALAHHHSWFVRQAAALAFMAMPPRGELFQVMCVQEEQEAQLVLSTTAKAIIRVYNLTQELYEAHGMLELP